MDENCGSESITKVVEGISNREISNTNSPLSNDENLVGEQVPEKEICNDNQDNDGNGVVDENCGAINNNDENQNTVIPEQEICGDLVDNDGNGLADEMCEINTTPNTDGSNPPISDNGGDTNPSNEAKTDKFGIRMLYPSKPNGEQWVHPRWIIPRKILNLGRQVPLSKNSDGSFKVTEGKKRMGVWPSTGNHPEKITTYNEKEWKRKVTWNRPMIGEM